MSAREVTLIGGSPWGFRMHGGHDLHQPLRISRVNPGSKAAQQGVREGDLISSINGRTTRDLTNSEAHALLRNAGEHLKLGLNQENIGSPKRRIYRSSLQENTTTEILTKTTTTTRTTTTISNTRIPSTDSKKNEANDAKPDQSYASQNGGPKSSLIQQRDETKKRSNESSAVNCDEQEKEKEKEKESEEQEEASMPGHGSKHRRNRKGRRRGGGDKAKRNDGDKNSKERTSTIHDEVVAEATTSSNHEGSSSLSRREDRCRIETGTIKPSVKVMRITTISSRPLEARLGHIRGVGIVETETTARSGKGGEGAVVVTVSEPLDAFPPLSPEMPATVADNSAAETRNGEEGLQIRDVTDCDVAEVDNVRQPVIVEMESDAEREAGGNLEGARTGSVSRDKEEEEGEEGVGRGHCWDTVMPRDVERKLRRFIEGLKLPCHAGEEGADWRAACEEEKRGGAKRRRREACYGHSQAANRFLDIIQEEGEKLSEDEEQHIRDFINEEIGKYRREERCWARVEEDLGAGGGAGVRINVTCVDGEEMGEGKEEKEEEDLGEGLKKERESVEICRGGETVEEGTSKEEELEKERESVEICGAGEIGEGGTLKEEELEKERESVEIYSGGEIGERGMLKEEELEKEKENEIGDGGESIEERILKEKEISDGGESIEGGILKEKEISNGGESRDGGILKEKENVETGDGGESIEGGILKEKEISKGESIEGESTKEKILKEKENVEIDDGGRSIEKGGILKEKEISKEEESTEERILKEKENVEIDNGGEFIKGGILKEKEIGNGEESIKGGILKEKEINEGESIEERILKEKENVEISNGEESTEKEVLKEKESSNGEESIEKEVLKKKEISNEGESIEEEILKKKENVEIGDGEESIEKEILKEKEISNEKESKEEGILKEKENVEIDDGGESTEERTLKEKEISNGKESKEEEILKEKENVKIDNEGESTEGGILKEKENVKISNEGESIVEGMLKEEKLEKKSIKISDGKEEEEEISDEKSEKIIESEILKANNENTNLSESKLKVEEEISVGKLDETDETLINVKSRSNEEESVDVLIHYRISDASNIRDLTVTENVKSIEEGSKIENRDVSFVKSKEIEVLKTDDDRKIEKSMEIGKLDLVNETQDFEALTVKSKLKEDDIDSKSEALTKRFLKKEEEEEPSKNNIAKTCKIDEQSDRLNETNEKLEQNKRSTSYHESSISKSILREEACSLTKDSYKISRDTKRKRAPTPPKRSSSLDFQERSTTSPLRGKRESKERIGENEEKMEVTSSRLCRDSTENIGSTRALLTIISQSDAGVENIRDTSSNVDESVSLPESNILHDLKAFGGRSVCLGNDDSTDDELRKYVENGARLGNGASSEIKRDYLHRETREKSPVSVSRTKQSVDGLPAQGVAKIVMEKKSLSSATSSKVLGRESVERIEKIEVESRETREESTASTSRRSADAPVERIVKIDVESSAIDESDEAKKCEEEERKEVSYESREKSLESVSIKQSVEKPVERIVKIVMEPSFTDKVKISEKERKKIFDEKPVERIVKINVESSTDESDKAKISKKCEEEEKVSYELREKSLESISIKQSVDKPVERIVKISEKEEERKKISDGKPVERIVKINVESSTDKPDKVKVSEKEEERKKVSDGKPIERIVKINVESSTDESDKTKTSKKCEEEERKKVSYELHEKSLESMSIKQSIEKPVERIVKINVESSTDKPDKVKVSEKEEERKKLSDEKPVERIVKINVESSTEKPDKTKISKKSEEEEKVSDGKPVERIVKINVESSTDESDKAKISKKCEKEENVSYELHEKSMSIRQSVDKPMERTVKISEKQEERKKLSDEKPVERIVKINVESSTEKPDKSKISKKCEEEEKVSYELREKSLESMSIKQSVDKPMERTVKISEKQEERKKLSDVRPVERIVKIDVESIGKPDKAKIFEKDEERTRKICDENGWGDEGGPRREMHSRHHRVHKKIVKNETSSTTTGDKERGNKMESSRELTTSEEEFEEIYKYSTRTSGDEPRSPAFKINGHDARKDRRDTPSEILKSTLSNDEAPSHCARKQDGRGRDSPSQKLTDPTTVSHRGPMEAWQMDIFSIITEEARKSKLRREMDSSRGVPSPAPPTPASEDLYYVPIESGSTYRKSKSNNIDETGPVESLKDICIKKILSMPYGLHVINEITVPRFNVFETLGPEVSKFPTHGPRKATTTSSEAHGRAKSTVDKEDTTNAWLGLSTSTDPKLLVCLSPSQRRTEIKTTADNLLDLHEKFINRRNYFDEESPPRVPPTRYRVELMEESKEDERGNRLLEIIKENSDKKSGSKSVTFEESSQSGSCNADGVPTSDSGRQRRAKATRLCDWLNLARLDPRSSRSPRHATPLPDDLLIESSAEGGEEPLVAKRLDIPRSLHYSSFKKYPLALNSAIIDSSSSTENPPFRSSTPFAKSPLTLNSAIIEKSVHFDDSSTEIPPDRPDPPSRTSLRKSPLNSILIDSSFMENPPQRPDPPSRKSPLNIDSFSMENPPKRPDPPSRKSPLNIDSFSMENPPQRPDLPSRKSPLTFNIDSSSMENPPERPDPPSRSSTLRKSPLTLNMDSSSMETPPERPDPPLRSSTPFRKSPVTLNSALIDSSSMENAASRSWTPLGRRSPGKSPVEKGRRREARHNVNPALIDDRVEVPPRAKRVVSVDRSCIDTTSIFDQNPPRSHLEPRRYGNPRHVAAASEIMDELRKLENETEEQSRGPFPPRRYVARQLRYIELLEDRLRNVILAEEEEREALEEYLLAREKEEGGRSNKESSFSRLDDSKREGGRGESSTEHVERSRSAIGKVEGESRERRVEGRAAGPRSANGEAFRRRMYDEYVRKVMEREERKHHKVVKISTHEDLKRCDDGKSTCMTTVEREFIEKARNRLNKFGINLDGSETETEKDKKGGGREGEKRVEKKEEKEEEEGVVKAKCLIDGKEFEDSKKLPKHLQEFLDMPANFDVVGYGCNFATKETDNEHGLLHEIDSALKFGKGFLFGKGVWSPGSEPPPKEPSPERKESEKDGGIPPIWTPSSAGTSPIPEKKEFRPVQFESPTLSRKKLAQQEGTKETPPPWETEVEKKEITRSSYESTSTSSRIVNSHSAPSQGLNSLSSTPRLPRAQNPTITLLQKAREGQLPKGAAYLEENEAEKKHPSSDEKGIISPGEIIYTVKKEYESEPETENEPPKKMADLGPRKFEGIGPTSKEGIPLVLRSEVKENNQTKWYKKMYDSLHRADRSDDYVTIRYKQRRGTRYGYGSGYLSEPEHRLYSDRSATLDNRRRLRNKENDFFTSTMPRKNGTLKYSSEVYKNQPGRIEDYEPGRSSIAEKEAKEWWDEVMDIFDGWLNDNGHPQGTEMEDLGDAQLSHRALSLSYRPEKTGRNVRVSAVSSSRTVELVPKNGRENAVDDERCRVRSSGQWSSASALDLPPRGYREKDSVEKDRWTVAARPVERAALADRGWQNAVGMLEGRSKSFVLPDRCLRRSASPIADNKSSANAVGSTLLPKATTITTDADRHRHQRHHHYYQHHHHHHHHHHHQRVSPTSSSSTSSSISSTNHVMLSSPSSSSATTPSLHNVQPRPFDQHKNRPPQRLKPYMSHALKESGYESDSTLVFRRKEDIGPLSELEQRLAYKTVQSGGDVPLHGLRKPAPERPKDETGLEYYPISPTLTRIRVHRKNGSSTSKCAAVLLRHESPLIEIRNATAKKMDVRSTIVSRARSQRDIALDDPRETTVSRPPSPPRRQSSRNSKTLKLYGNAKRQTVQQPFKSRHKQCFDEEARSNVATPGERLNGNSDRCGKKSRETVRPCSFRTSSNGSTIPPPRSKVSTPSCKKKTEDSRLSQTLPTGEKSFSPSNVGRIYGNSSSLWRLGGEYPVGSEPKRDKSSSILKMASKYVSPSATKSTKEKLQSESNGVGNTVSYLRKTNASRKRLTRKEQEESSRRLARSSIDLSSMETRKRVLQKCREKGGRDVRTTVLPSGTLVKSSTMLYSSSSSSGRQRPSQDKSLKVVVTVSSKGQEILRKPLDSISAAKSTSSLKSSSATSSPSVIRRTVLTDTKKPVRTIIGRPDRMGSSREFTSSSDAIGESSKRKGQRPRAIVRSPVTKQQLETIRINPDKRRIETRKRSRKVENSDVKEVREGMESDVERSNIENEEPNIRKIYKSKEDRRSSSLSVEEIKKHGDATRTDTFFQNLFLRSISSSENVPSRRSIIGERARMYQENSREGSKSEPSLKSLSIYLAHKRPVSNSKFKNWEKESISSRSSSPYGVSWPGRSVFQKVSKFDSLLGIEDFGSSTTLRNKSPDSVKERLKERSLSEPPLKTLSECSSSRASSPSSSIRSPACRRIRSLKQEKSDGPGAVVAKKVRARSAGEAEEKFGSNLSLARSTGSLCGSPIDREEYHRYVMGVLHDRRRSERYKELHDFYSSLERLGELERTFSSTDLRPRMKNEEEIIDYDRWRKVRSQERAEVEFSTLYGKLKAVQKDKNFLFSTKDIGKYKWHGDRSLRCKERSVENIIQHFKKLQSEGSELDCSKRREISLRKDTYKPLWRGTSVINVASTMQEKANGSKNLEKSLDHLDQPSLQRSLGGSKKFWSSLSIEQVATLKKQLNEIYGSDNLQRSVPSTSSEMGEHNRLERKEGTDKEDSLSRYEIIVPPHIDSIDKDDAKGLHVRCHSMITSDTSPNNDQKSFTDRAESLRRSGSISRGKSVERSESDKSVISVTPSMSELEKKRLSVTIGKEVLDKISQRRLSMPLTAPRETRGSIAAALAVKKIPKITRSSTAPSVTSTSPRSCYSLEPQNAEDSSRVKEKNDFLLVLTPNNKTPSDRRRVENVLEEWSRKPPLLAITIPDTPNQTKIITPNSGSEANSTTESSETSVRTVIQRNIESQDVPAKIEFFENVDKSADTQSVKTNKKEQTKRKPGRLSSSQSFADLRELFGESEAGKYALSGCRTRSISPRGTTSDERKGNSPAREMDANTRPRFCSRDREHDRPRSVSPCRATTRSNSSCSLESIWLRSSSPDPDKYWRAYLKLVRNGTVRRLRAKFESAEDLRVGRVRVFPAPKKFQSDPELARCFLRKVDEGKLKPHEFADVAWLRRKYEPRRGRARRRGESPPIPRVPLRKEDLSMPHIDVISKTAELKDSAVVTSTITNSVARKAETKELEAKKSVGRMRKKFEKFATQKTSILGEMFTSSPDVHELRDIAPYLAGRWVAHRYPSRRDNMRSLSSPPDLAGRPCSASKSEVNSGSTRTQSKEGGKLIGKVRGVSSKGPSSILKQSDGDQTFDPDKHRPKFRYQPPPPISSPNVRRKATCWWSPIPIYTARPTVTFEGLNFHNIS